MIDYSAPNVAKEMHVGHLRSTIIGDAAVRTLEFLGHKVIRVMAVAKKLGMPPRQLAEQVLTHLDLSGIASKTEIAGPGFINIFLEPAFLASHVDAALKSDRLGVSQPEAQTVVIDYSAPNVAKEMHVGHLRSTIMVMPRCARSSSSVTR